VLLIIAIFIVTFASIGIHIFMNFYHDLTDECPQNARYQFANFYHMYVCMCVYLLETDRYISSTDIWPLKYWPIYEFPLIFLLIFWWACWQYSLNQIHLDYVKPPNFMKICSTKFFMFCQYNIALHFLLS